MKMNKDPQMETQNSISFSLIVPFLVITFIISWGILALYIFLSEPMTRLFGQLSGNHPLFFLGVVSFSMIMTALFNDSMGSILLPAVMHFQLISPIWPDAQPYDTYILAIIAVVVVWIQAKKMFRKSGGITEILPITSPHSLF